jgi:hypothetical protein
LKRTLLPLALVASFAFGGTALAVPRSHAVLAHARVAGAGTQGGKSLALGVFSGAPFGADNVVLFKFKVTGTRATGTFTSYNSHGSLRGTFTQTVSPQPDNSVKYAGTARVLGGAGAYRGATGNVTLTGNSPANSTVIFDTITGSVRY